MAYVLAKELMKKPKEDIRVNAPIMDPDVHPGAIHQADLLFLPHDRGYKYTLTVVDVGTKLVDAEPLKNKRSDTVKKAFEKIYKRSTLRMPKFIIQVDPGSEFKGDVYRYFQDHDVIVRYGKTNRHRQQALVEAYNGVIARALFEFINAKELETGNTSREWVKNLRPVLKWINKTAKDRTKRNKKLEPTIRCKGTACDLIPLGTEVRVILDQPQEATGIKLSGKFRSTDLRWENKIRTIEDYVLRPYQPPMYKVSGIDNVNYTKNQLQVVNVRPLEPKPKQKKTTKKPTKKTAEKTTTTVIGKRKRRAPIKLDL